MYKLIALDLDDTLLGPDATIGAPEKAALTAARSRGFEVTLVTARAWRSTRAYVQELDLTAPVICMTGAVVYTLDGAPLWQTGIPAAEAHRIASWADEAGWCYRLYFADGRIYQSRAFPADYIPTAPAHAYPADRYWGSLLPYLADDAEPIQIAFLGDRCVEELLGRLPQLPSLVATTYDRHSTVSRTHLMHRDVSKGAALERYCRERGIPREAVIAMGDGETDRSMIEWAGTGVAMGWAPEPVRRAANLVASKDDPHPVATVLTELLGL